MRRSGEASLQTILLLIVSVGPLLGGVLVAWAGLVFGDTVTADPAGWLAPIVGNATAAGILAAVVLYLGPQAIREWRDQHNRLVASFFGDERNPGAVGRITEQMSREREQCATQFEKLMSSVTAQQGLMQQMLDANRQLVDRMTRIEGQVNLQARHVTAIVEPTRREGHDSNPGGR